jgi:hypothetical protein
MKKQTVFEKVCKHLLKQNTKSKDKDNYNLYHNGKLRCAIGCLIPKTLYTKSIEGKDAYDLVGKYNSKYQKILKHIRYTDVDIEENVVKFYSDLQNIHDSYKPSEWKEKLREFANHHDTIVPECLR